MTSGTSYGMWADELSSRRHPVLSAQQGNGVLEALIRDGHISLCRPDVGMTQQLADRHDVDALPREIRFPVSAKALGRAIVSVKGGEKLTPTMVRDLVGTVKTQ